MRSADSDLVSRRWKVWLIAVRPFSFTASLIPGLVAAGAAVGWRGAVRWELLPPAMLGAVLLHAATNLLSDAADYQRGVDRPDTYGGSGMLVGGYLTCRQAQLSGLLLLALGLAVGGLLLTVRGWPVLWLALAGAAGGFFYGGRPVGYKYVALGDLMVFLLMGPLLVSGTHFVLTGTFTLRAALLSLPVGALVVAILAANNIRDIRDDQQAGFHTVASLLGPRGAKAYYLLLVGGAYAAVGALVAAGIVGPWALLTLLTLPPAARNVQRILSFRPNRPTEIAEMDMRSAQVHLLFGLLLTAGLIFSGLS